MDLRIWTLLLNTALLCGATCAVSLPLGTLLAGLLVRTDLPGRRVAVGLLALMLFVPLYLQAAAWQAALGTQGWYTAVTGQPGWLGGWTGAVWVHAAAAVPWVVLIVGFALRLIEPELEEQALLHGSARRVFLWVTLRGAWPAIGVAALWVAVLTAREMTVTDLFVVRTFAEELYTQSAFGPPLGEKPLGILSGAGATAVLVAVGLVLCARLMPGDRPLSLRRSRAFRLGRFRWPASVFVALVMLMLVGVPVASLCSKAGVVITQADDGWQRHFSPAKCLSTVAAAPWHHRRELGWSLGIGALAATAAVVVALGLAWTARRGGLRAVPALAVTAVCLATPGPLIGLGIVWLLNRPNVTLLTWAYDRSILAPWLALFVVALPPATLILWHALRTVPGEMLDAAAVDGAGRFARLWRIVLPSRAAAIGLAWVVALALALGELGASIAVVPPGVMTFSIQIFDLLHSGVEDRVAGATLALMGLFGALAAVAARLAGRAAYGN